MCAIVPKSEQISSFQIPGAMKSDHPSLEGPRSAGINGPIQAVAVSSGSYSLPLMARAEQFGDRVAIADQDGEMTYRELLRQATQMASRLRGRRSKLEAARIAFLASPGRHYVVVQWGIWLAGGVAVPLCITHPRPEQEYVIADADVSTVVAGPGFEELGATLAASQGRRFVNLEDLGSEAYWSLPKVDESGDALILYTSGTTGKPKGVVTTHRNLMAQVTSLIEAWEWTKDDRILHVLPLHHLHGILNVLICPLWTGAICQILPRFEAVRVWQIMAGGKISLFMAVPSVYQRLIQAWEESDVATRQRWSRCCRAVRLMVCGSAALPIPILEKWRQISGHTLLERFGMTEIGMGLSNPLKGERVPGAVGSPLPGVEVRLVDETDHEIDRDEEPGLIEVRGPNVFRQYWRRPDETAKAFHGDWFRTGDMGVRHHGIYRILGRSSVDIIKSGGYKISALEIEQVLLGHEQILECAVVGIPDEAWGERVSVAIRWRGNRILSLEELREWSRQQLAIYKVPSRLLTVDTLPRNAMGKVIKKDVALLFTSTKRHSTT
jgi:malonyl-CoA/methylmalonyl-CoA synthetase